MFEDVLVADGGAEHLDLAALEGGFEAHVGHGGGDDGGVGEKVAGLEVAGGEEEDGVSVDDVAMLVGEEGAVGVAVEGDAHGGLDAGRLRRRRFSGWRAPQFSLMLRPVGLAWVMMTSPPRPAKSWGATELAAPLAQSMTMRWLSRERLGTWARRKRTYSARSASLTAGGLEGVGSESWGEPARSGGRFLSGFDLEFGCVGELVAVGAEELDAVVLPWVVGGGDDDTGGEAVGLGEEGDGGCGDDAGGLSTVAPPAMRPLVRVAAIQSEDSRVSWPMRNFGAGGTGGGGTGGGAFGDGA